MLPPINIIRLQCWARARKKCERETPNSHANDADRKNPTLQGVFGI
jgi:hypothetical protein